MPSEKDTLIEEKLKHLLALIDDSEISSIKSIVSELVRLINDPKSSASDLKEVIEKDPLLSAKLLKLANSAYYGFSKEISDIQDAVVCVGFENLKQLAMNQKIRQLFDDDDIIAGYSRALLWKHSVAVALCGKLIYKNIFEEPSGNIYVAGLVHDIGIIIEEQFMMNKFFQILDEVNSSDKNLVDVEEMVLGYNHTDVGRAVATVWNFPEELAVAVGNHHSSEKMHDEQSTLARILFMADYLCHQEGIGYSYETSGESEAFEVCRARLSEEHGVNLDDETLGPIRSRVADRVAEMESSGWF